VGTYNYKVTGLTFSVAGLSFLGTGTRSTLKASSSSTVILSSFAEPEPLQHNHIGLGF